MKRLAQYLTVFVLLTSVWQHKSHAAPIIFDTAAPPITSSSTILGDFNWPFHRFEITALVTLDTVGGYFRNSTGMDQDVFAAIVQLSGPADNPDSIDLTTPDVLGTTLIAVGTSDGSYEHTLPLTLVPGWYALQFGTGAFGASSGHGLSDLSMPHHTVDLDPSQLDVVAIQIGHPSLPPGFSVQAPAARFFATATEGVNLAALLGNSGFEDDLVHSQWTATKKNNNYRLDAPVVNPVIIPHGTATPLEAPAGDHFVGILNPDDADINGRLVHDVVAEFFPAETEFVVTVWANRGRLEGASSPDFTSQPSGVSVQFFGWGAGKVPVVNPNTDNWSRRPSVNLLQNFTKWAANGEWVSQTFAFETTQDLHYISLAITGKNHIHASYVAFDIE